MDGKNARASLAIALLIVATQNLNSAAAGDLPKLPLFWGDREWLPHLTAQSVSFSPDGKTLASGGQSDMKDHSVGTVEIWDLATKLTLPSGIVSRKQVVKLKHGGPETLVRAAFSPDGKTLASGLWSQKGDHDKSPRTLKLWDAATGKELATLTGHTDNISSLVFTPDGATLISADLRGAVKLWDVAGRTDQTLMPPSDARLTITLVAVSPDGKTLAVARSEPFKKTPLTLWDLATHEQKSSLTGHDHHVTGLAFSPDGKSLASASAGGKSPSTLKIWNLSTGEERTVSDPGGAAPDFGALAFSPDGNILAAIDSESVKLFDTTTAKRLAWLVPAENGKSVTFSPDGKTVAAASNLGVRLWDVAKAIDFNSSQRRTSP